MFKSDLIEIVPTDKYKFTTNTFNFGNIPKVETVNYEIVIKNITDKPVFIEDIKNGCGCTTSEYSRLIEPNTTNTISYKINYTDHGVISKKTTITVSQLDTTETHGLYILINLEK